MKGGSRYLKMERKEKINGFGAGGGQSNLFTDVQSRSICSQVEFVFIFFQLFLD